MTNRSKPHANMDAASTTTPIRSGQCRDCLVVLLRHDIATSASSAHPEILNFCANFDPPRFLRHFPTSSYCMQTVGEHLNENRLLVTAPEQWGSMFPQLGAPPVRGQLDFGLCHRRRLRRGEPPLHVFSSSFRRFVEAGRPPTRQLPDSELDRTVAAARILSESLPAAGHFSGQPGHQAV